MALLLGSKVMCLCTGCHAQWTVPECIDMLVSIIRNACIEGYGQGQTPMWYWVLVEYWK